MRQDEGPDQDAGPEAASDAAERELLTRLRAGDGEAFEELVRANGRRLLAVARRLTGSEEDARDVFQDALLSAFRAMGSFAGEARLSTWLHRIVVNMALMRLRSRRRRPEEPLEPLLPTYLADGHHAKRFAEWPGVEQAMLRRELRAQVRQGIERLPDSYRTVLLLRDIEGLDTREAADAMGITENAVKIRLHRARQALRTLLEPVLSSGTHA